MILKVRLVVDNQGVSYEQTKNRHGKTYSNGSMSKMQKGILIYNVARTRL